MIYLAHRDTYNNNTPRVSLLRDNILLRKNKHLFFLLPYLASNSVLHKTHQHSQQQHQVHVGACGQEFCTLPRLCGTHQFSKFNYTGKPHTDQCVV